MKKMHHPLELFKYCPECGSAEFHVKDEKSKRCSDCGFVYYFNASAATVAFILNAKGELLVCRRAKEPKKGTLDLAGGFIDRFETAEEGVAREVLEETGLEVTETVYQFSLPNTYLYSGFLVHTLDMFFLCKVRRKKTCVRWMMWPIPDGCLWNRSIRRNSGWIRFVKESDVF